MAGEHNNTMEKFILNFTHIYIGDMRTKKALSDRSVLVKIANNNFMPTLRGFRWYPYFVAQEKLVAFEAST